MNVIGDSVIIVVPYDKNERVAHLGDQLTTFNRHDGYDTLAVDGLQCHHNRQHTQRINIRDSAHSEARKIAGKIEQTRLNDAGRQ